MSRTLLILGLAVFLAAPTALSQDDPKARRSLPPEVAEMLKARARAAAERRAAAADDRRPNAKPAAKKPLERPRVKPTPKAVVVRLDGRQFTRRKRIVYDVKHLPALDLAHIVGELLEAEPRTEPAATKGQSVVLVPEPITNVLIISGPPEVLEEVVDFVERLDRQPPMVRVRTLIAEITVDDPKRGQAHMLDELTTSVSDEGLDELAAALRKRPGLRILGRPQLTALGNQPAFLQLGQRVPRITGVQTSSVGRTNTVTMENVGLILGVTARVNAEGLITMEIDLEKSDLGPAAEGVPISVPSDGDPVVVPNVETLTVQTTISAASGQTVILGGIAARSGSRRKELILLVSPEVAAMKKAKR